MIGTNNLNLNQRNNLVLPQTVQLKSTQEVGSQDAVNKNTGEAKTSAVFDGKRRDKTHAEIYYWKDVRPGDKLVINGEIFLITKVEKWDDCNYVLVTIEPGASIGSDDWDRNRGYYPEMFSGS